MDGAVRSSRTGTMQSAQCSSRTGHVRHSTVIIVSWLVIACELQAKTQDLKDKIVESSKDVAKEVTPVADDKKVRVV